MFPETYIIFYAEIKEKLIDSGECEVKSKMKIYSLSSFKTCQKSLLQNTNYYNSLFLILIYHP